MKTSRGSRVSLLLASILLVTVLTAGTAIVIVTSTSRDNTVDLAERVAPASLLLLNLDRDAYQAELYLERVVHEELEGRDALDQRLLHTENRAQLTGERWTKFREIAADLVGDLPGEAEQAAMFDADRATWAATADLVLVTPPGATRDELVEQAKTEFETMRNHLDILEEEYWEPQIGRLGSDTTSDITAAMITIVATVAVVAAITVALTITNIVALRRQARDHARREGELMESTRRQSFETVLRRALEMARTETAALGIVARATDQSLDRVEMSELLLSNSSRSHLRSAHRSAGDAPGCSVVIPGECRAVVTGSMQVFADSTALDACPHLANRSDSCRTAICVPVSINGRASGALHATRDAEDPFDELEQSTLMAIANHTGIQLSVLRNQEIAAHQASTDPLTGLANRRSLEAAVQNMRESHDRVAVLMVDIDHFKELNDTHGHETGDRALRLFADAARDVAFDDGTVAARWGGEEFVLVTTDASLEDGGALADRLREALAVRLIDAATPTFTVSIGVAAGDSGRPLHELLESADQALYQAKQSGRDRISLAATIA